MDPNAGKRDLVNKLDKESLRAKLEAETFKRDYAVFLQVRHH